MLEELLKNINTILKKNKDFFEQNPELFIAVKERFEKAIYDENEDEDQYMRDEGFGGFDDPYAKDNYSDEDTGYDEESTRSPSYESIDTEGDDEPSPVKESSYDPFSDDEDTQQEQYLRELEQKQAKEKTDKPKPTPQASARSQDDEDMYEGADEDIKTAKEARQPTARGTKTEWKPKSQYLPHHSTAIENFLKQGFSAREAENLAGAHDFLSQDQIVSRNMQPSEPSEGMLKLLGPHAHTLFGEKAHKIGMMADPASNPNLHLNSHKNEIISQIHKPYKDAALEFRKQKMSEGKSPDEVDDMMYDFEKDWHQKNPQHAEQKHAAANKISQIANENKELSSQKLMDARAAVALAHHKGGEDMSSITGDTSKIQAGGTKEATRQSIGGVQEEDDQPTSTGTVVDPAHSIARSNPAFIKELQRKIVKKLDPSQLGRLNAIDGTKKKDGQ
jgi:hypothetical protein